MIDLDSQAIRVQHLCCTGICCLQVSERILTDCFLFCSLLPYLPNCDFSPSRQCSPRQMFTRTKWSEAAHTTPRLQVCSHPSDHPSIHALHPFLQVQLSIHSTIQRFLHLSVCLLIHPIVPPIVHVPIVITNLSLTFSSSSRGVKNGMKRLPKLIYTPSLLPDKELNRKLTDLGLPLTGNRQVDRTLSFRDWLCKI